MLAVSIGLFISPSEAQEVYREPGEQPMLVDSHVLSGVGKILVEIIPLHNKINEEAPPWKGLPAKIQQKFDEAQIDIRLRPIFDPSPNSSILPELQISIDTLEIENSNHGVYHIQTVFKKKVQMLEKPLRYIKADVWKTKPVMKAVSSDKMPKRLTEEVLEQVQAFISAYKAANSKNADFRNENPSNTRLTAADLPKRAKTAVTPQAIQAGFVASKNSKVFHNADCQWVNKIKPENLVIYNAREQAVNAGKRPCKLCKP